MIRRRALRALLALAGLYLLFGVTVRARACALPGGPPPASRVPPPRALAGAVHVHTEVSHDGRGSLAEVARAARRASLDFVVLADHNVPPPAASYVDGVLIVPGAELSTEHGHLAALGGWRGPQRTVAAVRAAGGRAVLAHPTQARRPWTGWEAETDWDGLEIVSLDSLWRAALASPAALLPALLAYPFAPARALSALWDREPAALRRWDAELERRPVAGLCSHDAHGLPSYEAPFLAMATYVLAELTGEPVEDARRVLRALFSGETWCALTALGPARDFRFFAASDGFHVLGGEAREGEVVWICAGEEAGRAPASGEAHLPRRDGPCRAEVRARLPGLLWGGREVTWIYTAALRAPAGPAPGSEW